MSRLTKVEVYAIRWLNSQNFTNEKIASELDLNVEQVKKTVEKYSSTGDQKKVPVKTSPVNIINTTSGKGIKGVSIMTKEGSEVGDKKHKPIVNKNLHKSIFRPKKNG